MKETPTQKTQYVLKSVVEAGIPATTEVAVKPVKAFIVTNTLLFGGALLLAAILGATLFKVAGLSWLLISLIFFMPILAALIVITVGLLAYKGTQYIQDKTNSMAIGFSNRQIDKI